jgi:hypothetical protein
MEPVKSQELPMLDIEKAIKATRDHAKELDELKNEGLTTKQAEALIKFTQELISPSEGEE